ncbi:hypothetical protein K4L06_17305 [Lysobacter sp. BMK333-48F3]|uniref:hypothetical protein n=1 Tax=Lysobacter sp. BMK333-48F3 TaxID=2867962 RepID=UPI001C8C6415|nr:hypothetical protein [Lysobacter sp. BMK333-48F3]MBX9403069.1 hypothetical protein [Lysobacter sp. BMK333-48F3]
MERHNGQRELRVKNSVAMARAASAHGDHVHHTPQPLPRARPSFAQTDFAGVSASPVAAATTASPLAGRADPNDSLTLPDIPPVTLQPPSLLTPRPGPHLTLLPPLRLPPMPSMTAPPAVPLFPTVPPPSLLPSQLPAQAPPGPMPPQVGREWSGWRYTPDDPYSRVDWLGIGRAYSARGRYPSLRDSDSFAAEAQRSAALMRTLGIPQRLHLGPLNLDLLNLGLGLQAGQLNARENPNFMDRMQQEWKWQNPGEFAIPPIPFFNRSF